MSSKLLWAESIDLLLGWLFLEGVGGGEELEDTRVFSSKNW